MAVYVMCVWPVHGDDPRGEVRNIINDVEKVLAEDRACNMAYFCPISLAEVSAIAAEKIGDDELAERYALFCVDRYAIGTDASRISAQLLLGRIEQRRGKRAAAVAQFEAATTGALSSCQLLMALTAGFECGGDEGASIVDRAVAAIGRPREELIAEYAAAGGKGE